MDGELVTMKKVSELPDFLDKIQTGRQPPLKLNFRDEKFEELVFNENFMDKLRQATELILDQTEDNTESLPPIILLNDNGNMIEQGTNDELLALKGTYWELYEKQLKADQAVES